MSYVEARKYIHLYKNINAYYNEKEEEMNPPPFKELSQPFLHEVKGHQMRSKRSLEMDNWLNKV